VPNSTPAPPDSTTSAPSTTAAPGTTAAPSTAAPSTAATPTTVAPGCPIDPAKQSYACITAITLANGKYQVTWKPIGFNPLKADAPSPERHVHFYFPVGVMTNPLNAGTSGPTPGSWFLWDAQPTFDQYGPADATAAGGSNQMCILIANSAHAVEVGTGNCFTLPTG
jgi:hypothetical protein